jgi:phosphohistidine phosphatase
VQLLVIRHAIAEPREEFAQTGQDDSLRPLSLKGRKRMTAAVRGIRALVPKIDTLATSPMLRAAQTAEMVAAAYEGLVALVLDDLGPDGERRSVLTWLQMQPDGSTVAVVGHEPYLGGMISWLLATPERDFVQLKKGGACLLEWPSHVTAGDAQLRWLLPAAHLRKLGKRKKPVPPEQEDSSGKGA